VHGEALSLLNRLMDLEGEITINGTKIIQSHKNENSIKICIKKQNYANYLSVVLEEVIRDTEDRVGDNGRLTAAVNSIMSSGV
jgi:ABC-type enterochelin transport system ATPase subunit